MSLKWAFFSLFIFGNVAAQQTDKTPDIEFETKVIDYGKIKSSSNGLKTFVFKNTGSAPLEIVKVYSSCGCTVPKKPEQKILPKQKSEIIVKYDTSRKGPFEKKITVVTNVKKQKVVVLKIRGEVE